MRRRCIFSGRRAGLRPQREDTTVCWLPLTITMICGSFSFSAGVRSITSSCGPGTRSPILIPSIRSPHRRKSPLQTDKSVVPGQNCGLMTKGAAGLFYILVFALYQEIKEHLGCGSCQKFLSYALIGHDTGE